MAASEEWIKHRAYELWEQEGYPSGKDKEHWERAKLEYTTLRPVASDESTPPKQKISAPKAEKPVAKPAAAKNATPKKAAKTPAAKVDAASASIDKSKPLKTVVAASATPDQTKKRPKKAPAE